MKKKFLFLSVLGLSLSLLGGCGNASGNSTVSSGDNCTNSGPVYRVYFYSNGGSAVDTLEVAAGSTATKPQDPVLSGKTFEAWYTTSNLTGTPYDFSLPVNSNLVLYAKWSSISSEEIEKYERDWAEKSEENHLYIHYLRFNNTPEEYEDWDIWSWPYSGDGTNFDFVKEGGQVVATIWAGLTSTSI